MNRKQVVLIVMIIAGISNPIMAQSNHGVDIKYSVTRPDDFQPVGKSYPLIVCYQNQSTDSLFQHFAKQAQTIILQIDNTPGITWNPDSLKAVIQRIMYAFPVAKDKIYLLGVNENIDKTSEIQAAMDYYFAATAYITSNPNTYTLLSNNLQLNNSIKLYLVDSIDHNALNIAHQQFLKHYLWAFNMEKMSVDAIKLKVVSVQEDKYNWQISLSYGQWYFANSAKAREKAILDFPQKMGVWNLSFARVLSEHISVNANWGVLLKKIEPPGLNIFSILAGDSVDIEGCGIFFMPISVGMDYFFLKKRFRPYAGIGFGIVPARYKFIEGAGSLSNGINRNERDFKSNAPFVELSAGFVYRPGKNIQWGLNGDYVRSREFSENIGGYKAFNGFKVSAVFSVFIK
jgi:hypothetical protein